MKNKSAIEFWSVVLVVVITATAAGGIYLKWCHPRSDEQRLLHVQKRVDSLERKVKGLKKQVKSCQVSSTSGGTSPEWLPPTESSWDYIAESFMEELQTFDLPLAPMTYWIGQNVISEGFFLRLWYVTGFVEICDTSERVRNDVARFETVNFAAEMDYSMGNLTILWAHHPIQQLSAQFRVELPESIL